MNKVVYIKWIDSSATVGWHELAFVADDVKPAIIETVGHLVAETDDLYILTTSVDIVNMRALSPMCIPKVAVLEFDSEDVEDENRGGEHDRQDVESLDSGEIPDASTKRWRMGWPTLIDWEKVVKDKKA